MQTGLKIAHDYKGISRSSCSCVQVFFTIKCTTPVVKISFACVAWFTMDSFQMSSLSPTSFLSNGWCLHVWYFFSIQVTVEEVVFCRAIVSEVWKVVKLLGALLRKASRLPNGTVIFATLHHSKRLTSNWTAMF